LTQSLLIRPLLINALLIQLLIQAPGQAGDQGPQVVDLALGIGLARDRLVASLGSLA
jgi:hypothetical protein